MLKTVFIAATACFVLIMVSRKDSARCIKIYGCYDGRESDPLLCMGKLRTASQAATSPLVDHLQATSTTPGETNDMVDSKCLACLCEASTYCNVSATCETPASNSHLCGAFRISRPYWIDAGKPIIKNDSSSRDGAFEQCVNDLYCAADTVRKYMIKFAEGKMENVDPDCNNDGVIDCRDFAFMHKIGGFRCQNPSVADSEFYRRFDSCWKVVLEAA